MNIKTTIAFLIIAIAAGTIAILKLRSPGNTGPNTITVGRLLDAEVFNVDDVDRISISLPGKPTYLFAREDEAWSQTEPGFFALDSWSVRAMVTSASDLAISETIAAGELTGDLTLSRLGLEPPAATISYDMTTGETFTIHLGRLFAGGRAYARLEGIDDVYVINDSLHTRLLDSNPTEWRHKNIFHQLGTEISRIEITNPLNNASLRLAQIDGKWRLISPARTHVDINEVLSLVAEFGGTRLRGFVDDTPSDLTVYGLAEPAIHIALETDRVQGDGGVNTDRQTLLLGHTIDLRDETRYAKRGERSDVFTVAAMTWKRITPDPVRLISLIPVDINASDIRTFRIETEGETFALRRTLNGWDFLPAEGDAVPANAGSMVILLARITAPLEGAAFDTIDPLKVEGTISRITVEGFNDQPVATISVGVEVAEDGSRRIVFDDGSGAIRFSSNTNVLPLSPDFYRTVSPLSPPEDEPTK